MNASKVIWCSRGWQPVYYGFCPSERAWKRELRRLGVPDEPYPTSDARCTYFERHGNTGHSILVTVSERAVKHTKVEIIGLIVHESMHVWRFIRECIGESDPSKEFEAYSIQAISQDLISAYERTRGRLCR